MKRFQNTIGLAVSIGILLLGFLPLASFPAEEPADPVEIEALVDALGDFVKRTPPILGSARLNAEQRQALQTALEQGTRLLEQTPGVEQKYWAAEFLIKARLTQAMVEPPNSLAELRKLEELVAILDQKPEKAAILQVAHYQILRYSILLLTRQGDDLPNPYHVKESVKRHVAENPNTLDLLAKLLVDVSIQYAARDRQFTIETIRDVAELYKDSEFLDDRAYIARLLEKSKRFELIGNPVAFSGVDLAGNKISSADFKDQVVLIDFWATWCAPCIIALPELKRLYETYGKQGFEIVGVSVDRNKDDLAKFLEERQLPWKILSDTATEEKGGTRLAKHFGVTEYPTLMLVGRDGHLIATDFDMKTLERELGKLFNTNSPRQNSAGVSPVERAISVESSSL